MLYISINILVFAILKSKIHLILLIRRGKNSNTKFLLDLNSQPLDHVYYVILINDWSAILLCLPCIIFHEYMCGFLLFTEFWCFAMRFSGCYKIWLSHRQNNIFVTKHLLAINNTTSE